MTIQKLEALGKRSVLVGVRLDGQTRELLDWALVKVADPGDSVVALHVTRSSDSASSDKSLLDGYLDEYEGLCSKKQVDLTAEVLKGSSIRKALVREAKNRAAVAIVLGITKHSALGGWSSVAKYCARRLPPATEVMAIHNGKIVFRRNSSSQLLPGGRSDPKPSFYIIGSSLLKDGHSEFGDSEISEMGRLSHEVSFDEEGSRDVENSSHGLLGPPQGHKRCSLRSISLPIDGLTDQKPGWPLLQTAGAVTPPALEAKKLSVVQWVMNLPNRSLQETPRSNSEPENEASGRESSDFKDRNGTENNDSSWSELRRELDILVNMSSLGCELFDHDTLESSTSGFSSEYLVGKGGCNRVYKGLLPDGKTVAVKVLKSSKEARRDFILEVDIMTKLKHKRIAPLLGVCVEHFELISVYDFISRGNLEENLHGNRKGKSELPWDVRFKIAVGIAEALNYLHNECPQPVIHRDVKSSNILLTDELEPLLSDFGLAIWGPTTASFLTHADVVGTFGYLAPEYFMYGKVSEKIDVYSFGVVLLELLSGKKPVGTETSKGQESLVMWAKPKLESGDLKSILDQDLDGRIDEAQMQRMVFAATLCLTQSGRLRPNISQILKILKGEKSGTDCINKHESSEFQDTNDDEVYPDSSAESHLSLALLDVNDDTISFSSQDQSSPLSVEEFLKTRWSRSSSLE